MLTNVGGAILSAYEMLLYAKQGAGCNLLIPYTECFFVRAPAVWGSVNIHTSVLTFFIERLYATVK